LQRLSIFDDGVEVTREVSKADDDGNPETANEGVVGAKRAVFLVGAVDGQLIEESTLCRF
jgi:hypothetical protein